MPRLLEYYISVRRLFSPAVPLLSLLGLFLFFTCTMYAQINAPPASVTSQGFGGRTVNGPPASVTSVGPRGYAPNVFVPFRPPSNGTRNGNNRHRHHRDDNFSGPYLYAYPVPYVMEPYATEDMPDDNNNDAEYQGGPTVFDRRGSGARSYVPPVQDPPATHSAAEVEQADAAPASPEPPPPSTILVFKDGHQLEISNYAVVGTTLFDLTPGHSRKIPLADLDLEGTQRQNEQQGVVFQLPQSLQAN